MNHADLLKGLDDPNWRIRNLYYVRDKEGKTVKFVPWPEQEKFLRDLWFRNIVPKARQRGFSTVVQLMMLDACLFRDNIAAAIIAQDKPTARKIFDDKISFAYERLPEYVKLMRPLTTDTVTEMKWSNGSSMVVSVSTRATTLQYLHVSEYGIICAKFPEKANEIQTGSLPSVDAGGVIVIESTVKTPYGIFSDMVRQAARTKELGRPLGKMEYKLHFASWWDADEYETDPEHVIISKQDHAYFERIEAAIDRPLSLRKRAWWVATRDNTFAGDSEKMYSEYPSTLEEAFLVSADGLWLSKVMARARLDHRITRVPWVPHLPVNTFWDLGLDDDMAIWFHQQVGPRDHWINYIEGAGEAYNFFVREMDKFGYVWGRHYLPHDGDQRRPGAEALKTPKDMLEDLGLKRIDIVPRIHDVTVGIDQLRDAFATYYIDEVNCGEGIKHLDQFSKEWNEGRGTWSATILKNGHQHAADAMRQHGQWKHNMRQPGAGGKRPNRTNRSGMAA